MGEGVLCCYPQHYGITYQEPSILILGCRNDQVRGVQMGLDPRAPALSRGTKDKFPRGLAQATFPVQGRPPTKPSSCRIPNPLLCFL